MEAVKHVYEVRPRKGHRGVDLISDAPPFDRLWYGEPDAAANAIGYAMHYSRSHDAVIRVYDAAGNVMETHEHKCYDFFIVPLSRHSRVPSQSLLEPFALAQFVACRS